MSARAAAGEPARQTDGAPRSVAAAVAGPVQLLKDEQIHAGGYYLVEHDGKLVTAALVQKGNGIYELREISTGGSIFVYDPNHVVIALGGAAPAKLGSDKDAEAPSTSTGKGASPPDAARRSGITLQQPGSADPSKQEPAQAEHAPSDGEQRDGSDSERETAKKGKPKHTSTRPRKKRKQKDRRKTAVSATNSFSMLVSGMFLGLDPIDLQLHPATPMAKPMEIDTSKGMGGATLTKQVTEESLTTTSDNYVRRQGKLSTRKDKRSDGLTRMNAKGSGLTFAADLASGRKPLHTEAAWYHSDEFEALLKKTVASIKFLLSAFAGSGPQTGASTAQQIEAWDADRDKRENAPEDDLPPELLDLLGAQLASTVGILINRSSCTSKSGYRGGCTAEGVETLRRFWDYLEAQLGPRTAGALRATSQVQIVLSVAARDTAAGDRTVTDLVDAGASVLVHEKFDASTAAAQTFDRNQYDTMKLIAQAQTSQRDPSAKTSASVKAEPDAQGLLVQFQAAGHAALSQLASELTALITHPGSATAYQQLLDVGYRLACATYLNLRSSAVSEHGPVGDAFNSFLDELYPHLQAASHYPTGSDAQAQASMTRAFAQFYTAVDQVVSELVMYWGWFTSEDELASDPDAKD